MVHILTPQTLTFPPLETASAEGLLALGGDLTQPRLLAAYQSGIFPWYNPGEPILWWSPDPRCVLFIDQYKPSRSLKKTIRRAPFQFTLDTAFARVIAECAAPRTPPIGKPPPNSNSNPNSNPNPNSTPPATWITEEMRRAYLALHHAGYAHSAEIWRAGELVGGLYGIALGRIFFGESMFSRTSDASKAALAFLIAHLRAHAYHLIDCQIGSSHLFRLGAVEIPRRDFIAHLQATLRHPTQTGKWTPAPPTPSPPTT